MLAGSVCASDYRAATGANSDVIQISFFCIGGSLE